MIKCNAVVITTYQGVRLYRNTLLRYQWDYIVLDEGHKIRNPDADITLTCKQVTEGSVCIMSLSNSVDFRAYWLQGTLVG